MAMIASEVPPPLLSPALIIGNEYAGFDDIEGGAMLEMLHVELPNKFADEAYCEAAADRGAESSDLEVDVGAGSRHSDDDLSVSISASTQAIGNAHEENVSHPRLHQVGMGSSVDGGRPTRKELKVVIEQRALEIEEDCHAERVQNALTVISEVPAQLEDALQRRAINVVNDMQFEVAAMRGKLTENMEPSAQAAEAADCVEQIPGIVFDTFEAKMAEVAHSVRLRLDEVENNCRSSTSTENLVNELCVIPDEIKRITNEAVEEAAHESQIEAKQRFDIAIAHLPHSTAVTATKQQVVPVIKDVLPDALADVARTMVENARQAVQAVQERPSYRRVVTNQVVADALLRAKVDHGPKPLREMPAAHPTNPGSLGHPELCVRPCLYFAAGRCVNGALCEFCHMPHPGRPAHLDKRHRELLKEMALPDLIPLVVPILEQKAKAIDLGFDVCAVLARLRDFASDAPPSLQSAQAMGRGKRSLSVALKAMSLRSLLTTLHRNARLSNGPEKASVDDILQQLLQRINTGHKAPRLTPAS